MEDTLVNPNGIRVIELPTCKMATSFGHSLEEFDRWWTLRDKKRYDKFFPRDFMYHDAQRNELVWLYALSEDPGEGCEYQIIDFKGGLYAAGVSIDQDDKDGERVFNEIRNWILATKHFSLDEKPDRPTLFHVITSDPAFSKMHFRQLDIYVPVA